MEFKELKPVLKLSDEKIISVSDNGIMNCFCEFSVKKQYENGLLLALFDGHEDYNLANYCATNLLTTIEKFRDMSWSKKLGEVIIDLQEQIKYYPEWAYQICSAIIIYISNDYKMYIASIGNARAMIINNKTGCIMKIGEEASYVVDDMMEDEYKKHDIGYESKNSKFITRSHIYNPLSEDNDFCPEYNYYKNIQNYKFHEKDQLQYLKINNINVHQLRVIGGLCCSNLIRLPELHTWMLNSDQLKCGKLVMLTDGLVNHEALLPESFAKIIMNPIFSIIENIETILKNTMIFKNRCLDDLIPKEKIRDHKIKIRNLFRNILLKVHSIIKNDLWIAKTMKSFDNFIKILDVYGGDQCDNLKLVINIAIMLGAVDSISINMVNLSDT